VTNVVENKEGTYPFDSGIGTSERLPILYDPVFCL
jgi:hypothetical protein